MRFRLNIYSKKPLSLLIIFLVILATALLMFLLIFIATKTVSQYYLSSPVTKNDVNGKILIKPGLPKKLIISSININVNIDYVGLKGDGAMDIKPNPNVVGWYMLGPRPGDKGNAVIAGHYGWQENGEPAVFNDIQKLNAGDELSIIDQNAQSIIFVVKEIRKYNPESDATTVFKSYDGKSHLNLITCDGVWENDKQSYSNRLVVFTDKK